MDNQENLTQEELQSKVDYIFANSFNHTQHAYIDIAGDLVAGTLLSQIMYWFSLDKNKKSKIRIFKDGNYWLAKGREDWYEEIRISPKQYDTAVKKLKEKGLVETKLYKFNSVPTTHIRPIFAEINSEINEWKKKIELEIASGNNTDITMSENSVLPNGGNGIFQSVNMEVDKKANSLTENTNSDYINRDYNTENTPNSFSKEKDNSKETLELHNSHFPEEQKNESRISMSLGVKQKQSKEKPLRDMPTRAKEIADSLVDDKQLSWGVQVCIEYFLGKYKQKNRKEHLPLRNETLQSVVEVMLSSLSVPHDEDLENRYQCVFYPLVSEASEWEDRKEVIDKYFDTDFREKCDYSLVHFTQRDIITHVMQKCYIGEDVYWFYSESVD